MITRDPATPALREAVADGRAVTVAARALRAGCPPWQVADYLCTHVGVSRHAPNPLYDEAAGVAQIVEDFHERRRQMGVHMRHRGPRASFWTGRPRGAA